MKSGKQTLDKLVMGTQQTQARNRDTTEIILAYITAFEYHFRFNGCRFLPGNGSCAIGRQAATRGERAN